MDSFFSGALEMIMAVGPFIFLAVIAYGIMNWRRSPVENQAADRATKRLYTNDLAQHDNIEGEKTDSRSATRHH